MLSKINLQSNQNVTYAAGAVVASVLAYKLFLKPIYRRLTLTNEWDLRGRVCLVTGASRGMGKAIAETLGKSGAIVYITGRTVVDSDTADDPTRKANRSAQTPLPGNLTETAELIRKAGGQAIIVKCDHSKIEDVKALFERIEKEQGRLDCLVNNAIAIRNDLKQTPPFWSQPLEIWDSYHDVGLKGHYVACVLAIPLMLKDRKKPGLIINISSGGGGHYLFNPAYGTAKAALDRLAKDVHVELKQAKANISSVSLWPGLAKTERMESNSSSWESRFGVDFSLAETPYYAGRAVAALLADQNVMRYSGKIVTVEKLAFSLNFTDVNGLRPPMMGNARFIWWHLPSLVKAYFNRRSEKKDQSAKKENK